MIDSMLQAGTDTALDDQVTRPRTTPPASPGFSLLGLAGAVPRGIGGGLSKSIAFGAEIVGAFGQVAGAYDIGPNATPEQKKQANAAREKLLQPGGGIDFSNEAGDTFRARAKDILPDPHTAHASEQVVAGLADFATRAVGYTVTLGPLGPLAMGGDAGLEEADRLKQEGVDIGTRTKAGAVAGVLNAAAVAIPMTGPTALARGVKGVAVGEGTIVGQSLAEREILRAAGYDKLAESFDPLDPVALALGVVPGALGARFGHAAPAKLKPLKTEADMKVAAALTPAEQARSDAYERSPTNLAELERAIKAEKNPQSRALLETELAKQRTAAREYGVEAALKAEPDLVPAARVAQTVQALDRTRLTPDGDLPGHDAHLSAVELAADQMGRGERVEVAQVARVPDLGAFMAASKALDDKGQPLTVYHGTDKGGFESFRTPAGDGDGIFFSTNPDHAAKFGGAVEDGASVIPARLRIENPLVIEGAGNLWPDQVASLIAKAKAEGRDGLLIREHNDWYAGPSGGDTWVAFKGEQVRPAIGDQRMAGTATAAEQLRAARQLAEAKAPAKNIPESIPVTSESAPKSAPDKQNANPSSGPVTDSAPSAVARAASEAEALNPDMLVQLEGMEAPMRVGDLLAKVKEEAKQDTLLGKLVEVAAECDLRT